MASNIINTHNIDLTGAVLIHSEDYGMDKEDPAYTLETLYRLSDGTYAVHAVCGPMGKYAIHNSDGSWSECEIIFPAIKHVAQMWARLFMTPDELEKEFGKMRSKVQ